MNFNNYKAKLIYIFLKQMGHIQNPFQKNYKEVREFLFGSNSENLNLIFCSE